MRPENDLTGNPSPFETRERKFLTGLIGRDILASRSPWLHEREADAQGVRLVYSLIDFAQRGLDEQDLLPLLDAAELLGFEGLNVTHPFKQAVIPYLDDLSEGARKVGAVNTISFAGGKRTGFNTDVNGFAKSFRMGLPDAALGCAVQLGAGGAGFATAHALLDLGLDHLDIFDKDASRAETLAARLAREFGEERISVGNDLPAAIRRADGVVNTTPVGMATYPGTPLPPACLEARHWVADIVYFPLETELLRQAASRGCRTLDGGGMAVHQAAEAFEIFTGLHADRTRMTRTFKEFAASSLMHSA